MGILQKIKNRLVISRQHSIIFEITQRCNLGCSHCYNVWKNHPDYPRGAGRIDELLPSPANRNPEPQGQTAPTARPAPRSSRSALLSPHLKCDDMV